MDLKTDEPVDTLGREDSSNSETEEEIGGEGEETCVADAEGVLDSDNWSIFPAVLEACFDAIPANHQDHL